jgi:hypothetical protein
VPNHIENYSSEKEGLKLLQEQVHGVHIPNKEEKRFLLELLGVDRSFHQSFDAVKLFVDDFSLIVSAKDFELIEVKTTKEELPELPRGFFFGLTENENTLLRVFQNKYFLAFVSTHPNTRRVELRNWKGVQELIHHKRIQYQINLIGSETKKPRAKSAKA